VVVDLLALEEEAAIEEKAPEGNSLRFAVVEEGEVRAAEAEDPTCREEVEAGAEGTAAMVGRQ